MLDPDRETYLRRRERTDQVIELLEDVIGALGLFVLLIVMLLIGHALGLN